jgi:hypothetical protein
MVDSSLLVFLPLVAAIVSALLGAYANGWYRDRQDKKAREREREGLLRIIDAELYENIRLLREIAKNADLAKYPSQSHVSVDAWNQSRARLAESLSENQDHIFAFNRHYALVVRIRATLEDPEALKNSLSRKERRNLGVQDAVSRADERGKNLLSILANRALTAGENARSKGEKYIGPLPDYHAADEEPSTGG